MVIFLAAIALSLVPVFLMGQSPQAGMTTRFLLPSLPLCACLGVRGLQLLAKRRFEWLVPALIGMVAGFHVTESSLVAIEDRQRWNRWGAEIQSLVKADRLTVAIVDFRGSRRSFQAWPIYEVTARMTKTWAPERRKAFVAIVNEGEIDKCLDNWPWLDEPNRAQLTWEVRGVSRAGPVDRILWIKAASSVFEVKVLDATPSAATDPRPARADVTR
jgi:hypothetical protein